MAAVNGGGEETYLEELCDTVRQLLVALNVQLQLIELRHQLGLSAAVTATGRESRE